MLRLALLLLLAPALVASAACASAEGTSASDDSEIVGDEQDVMMASVHGKLDRALGGQTNDYLVRHIQSQDGFAFLAAEVRGKERALDWSKTSFYPEIQGGRFELLAPAGAAAPFSVLLQRTASGRWLVIDLVVGAKDGALAGDGYEGAPRGIFPGK